MCNHFVRERKVVQKKLSPRLIVYFDLVLDPSMQLEGQATDVKLVTELPIGPVMNMDLLEAKNSQKQTLRHTEDAKPLVSCPIYSAGISTEGFEFVN